MTYQTKKLILYVLAIGVGTAFVVALFEFPEYSSQFGTLVLALTLGVLMWYAHDTNRIANETVSQTELQTMPIMALYIRNIDDGTRDEKTVHRLKQYAITQQVNQSISPSPFFIALRNMGNGPAFNTVIENENFLAEKYQTRFFAPLKDEHAVKVIKKPADKIRNLADLNAEVFSIKCQSFLGKHYEYKYRIVDVEEKIVEFLK